MAGRPPASLAGVLRTAVAGGAQKRVAIRIREPGSAGVLELPKAAAERSAEERRSGSCYENAQRKVWLFTSSSRSPRGVGPQRQSEMAPPGAGRVGDFSCLLVLAGCGCRGVNEEQRLRTSQPGGAGMPKPAGRRQASCWAGKREGKQSLSDGALQVRDGLMSVSARLPGARLYPPHGVPRAPGELSEVSLGLRPLRPQPQQLVEIHQSVLNREGKGEREHTRAAGTSPMTTSENLPDPELPPPSRLRHSSNER